MEFLEAWLFNIKANVAYNWHLFALLALLFYGLYQYLLDSSIEARSNTFPRPLTTCPLLGGASLTIVILSGIYLVAMSIHGKYITHIYFATLLGFLQGILFLFAHLFRFEARKIFSNSVVLPITRANVLIVILASWTLFDEFSSVTGNNLVGFTLLGMAIYLFKDFQVEEDTKSSSSGKKITANQQLIAKGYLLTATIATAAISLLSKYAVGPSGLNIFLFMFLSNYAIIIMAYGLFQKSKKEFMTKNIRLNTNNTLNLKKFRGIFIRGMCLGVFNFLAFASLLYALSLSDASVVIPIYSLYIIIPVILAAIIQGKELRQKTTVAVILSIAALIILE